MKINIGKIASFLALLAFMAHAVILDLQRYAFTNEAFSLLGAFSLTYIIFSRKLRADKISLAIFIILSYAAVSFTIHYTTNKYAGAYEKLRTLPIAYSMLCFYFGYCILNRTLNGKLFTKSAGLIRICAGSTALFIGGVLAPPAAIALTYLHKKNRTKIYISLITFITTLFITKAFILGSGDLNLTILVMLAFVITMLFFRNSLFKLINNVNLINIIILFALIISSTKFISRTVFFPIAYDLSIFSDTFDVNALWRLMFWSKTIDDMTLSEWMFGIGLATPIFNEADPLSAFIIASDPDALYRPYTLGLHNSPLTFFVRFGFLGLALVTYIITRTIKGLVQQNNLKNEVLFLSLTSILIASIFNVIWESPLYAGIFWAIVGISAKQCSEAA